MRQGFLLLKIICCTALVLALFQGGARAQTTVPQWRAHTALPVPLTGHGAVLLPTGDILIAGGLGADGSATRASYLYSPATGAFRPTINQLIAPRAYHSLVAVSVGGVAKVFAIGGFSGSGGSYTGEGSIEVLEYDAAQGNWRWRGIGGLGTPRGECRAAWDGGNFVVITGGYTQSGGAVRSGARSTACDRIDIAALTVAPISPMSSARAEHATARIIGDNGAPQILTAGGEDIPAATATQLLVGTAWDPIANPPLAYHTAGIGVGDPAGIARVFGGMDAAGAPLAACEWYDTKRGWRTAPRMALPRARFDAGLVAGLSDTAAAYLAIGGTGTAGALAGTEVFNLPGASFPNGTWVPFPSLIAAGSERHVAIAGSNLPLVSGGRNGAGAALGSTEIFQPFRANDIAFGDEEVGRRSDSATVTIENTWLLPVRAHDFRIAGSAEFIYRGDTANFTIPPGGSRTIRVYFQPAAPGARAGLLLFGVGPITDTVRLSGRGIASQIAVINSPLDFGTQLITTRRTECAYVLRNNGTDTAVIDSIVLAPPGAFRLVSPLGRTAIAPGDSLRICVEFAPAAQGAADATATIFIAARSFPLQVLGNGIRRFVAASVITSECDTVQYAPGVQSSGFILLSNPGDTVVNVGVPTLQASANGLFRLANPAQFPLDIKPGDAVTVEVIFTPQRESREVVTVDFPNNGDTAAGAALCFVARSRYLSVSQPVLDMGSVCVGDTATALITIENPGGFDSVGVVSAAIDPANVLTVTGFSPRTLGPREYITLAVSYTPIGSGPLGGTLTVRSSRGDVAIPVNATALAAARFSVPDGSMTIGDTATLPVSLQGLSGSGAITNAHLTVEYDPTLLMPIGVASLNGAPPIDASVSRLVIDGNGLATIDLQWPGGLAANGAAFGLRFEALRGNALATNVALGGASSQGFCIARSLATITLVPACIGSNGFISAANAEFMSVSPIPASDAISIILASSPASDLRVEIIDAFGAVAGSQRIDDAANRVHALSIPVAHLPAGAYIVRARDGARVIASHRVMIAR